MQLNLVTAILLFGGLHVSAKSVAQITLKEDNVEITKVFKHIEKQSGYSFLYNYELLQKAGRVSVNVKNVSLKQAITSFLPEKGLTYSIEGKTIVIRSLPDFTVFQNESQMIPPVVVHGSVVDSSGSPIINATIKVVGKNAGTVTDASGKFQLTVESGDELEISFVGYRTKLIRVTSAQDLKIVLLAMTTQLNDVIMIGYGTQRKTNVTGAIASVNMKQISADVSDNLSSAIQGRVPGVTVESNGGAPGTGLSLTIRGSSTLGNNTPLYVVDGVFVSSLDFVNPQDVQSIQILKDASAASIYGSRAANGVVIITTKSGRKNSEVKVQITGMYGTQSIPKRMSLLNGQQWTTFFQKYVSGIPAYNGINTDWQSAIFRNAPLAKTNFNVSGGSEHFTYNLSGGYMNQDGTIKATNYSLANFRVKTQYDKGRLSIGETVIFNKSNARNMNTGASQAHSLVASALIMPPTVPVYDTTNTLGGWGRHASYMKNIGNPLANLEAYHLLSNNSSFLGEAFAEVRLVDQLKYKFNVGLTENRGFTNNYADAFDDGNSASAFPNLAQSSNYSNSWLLENTLSYDKTIGKHHFTLLAGWLYSSKG